MQKISGALNPLSKEADNYALIKYESIRKQSLFSNEEKFVSPIDKVVTFY